MFAEVLSPIRQEAFPTPILPGVDIKKGRERLMSGIKNAWEIAKNRVQQFSSLVQENKALALVGVGAVTRAAMSTLFDGDLQTVDAVSKTAFAAGMLVDRAIIPVAEKFTGIEVDKHPLLSKLRSGLTNLTAFAGGVALGGLADSTFNPGVVFADGPQGTQENLENFKDPITGLDRDGLVAKLQESGKNFIASGGIVLEDGTVILDSGGEILPSEPFNDSTKAFDTPGYDLIEGLNDLVTEDARPPIVDVYTDQPDVTIQRAVEIPDALSEIPIAIDQFIETTEEGSVELASEVVSTDPKWQSVAENGELKIQNLLNRMGVEGEIDQTSFVRNLGQAIRDFEAGRLIDDSSIGRLFHFSNGTGDLSFLQNDPKFVGEMFQQGILIR